MAKSKHAPALFEVIQGRQKRTQGLGPLALPKWWQSGKADGRADGGDAQATAQTREPAEPGEVEPAPSTGPTREAAPSRPAPRADRPIEDETDHPRLLRVRSGRVEISLNPVGAAVAGGVLLLALLVSYRVGYQFGLSAPAGSQGNAAGRGADEVEDALARPPNWEVLNVGSSGSAAGRDAGVDSDQPGPGSPAGAGFAASGGTVQRRAGLNYVVLESFKTEHRDDALHAQAWLASKNVSTTLEKRGDRWELVSVDGFDYKDPAQKRECRQYCDTVESLGKTYRQEFAGKREIRYGFLHPQVRKY